MSTTRTTKVAALAGAVLLASAGLALGAGGPRWSTTSPAAAARAAAPWASQHPQLRLMQNDAVLAPLAAEVGLTAAQIRARIRTAHTSLAKAFPGVDVVGLLTTGITGAHVTLPSGASAADVASRMAAQVPQGAGVPRQGARRGAGQARAAGQGARRGGGTGTCRATA